MKNTIMINVEHKAIIHKDSREIGISNENNIDSLNIKLDKDIIKDNSTLFLEIEFPDETKKFIEMDKVSTSEAEIVIKNSLLKQEGYLNLQFVVRSENNTVFKSEIFKLHVKKAINATESIEDEYPNVLDELENLKLRVKNIEENPSGGGNGKDGTTFIPYVSEDGILSWINDGELENPKPVNIKGKDGINGIDGKDGKPGKDGTNGVDGQNGKDGVNGYTPIKGADYSTQEDITEIANTTIHNINEKAKWKELSLNEKWTNIDSPYFKAQYQNIFGHVFFRGTVKNTVDADTTILILPEEIRPKGYLYAIANYSDSMGSFRIGPDGSFAVVNYTIKDAWVDLSCVHFGLDEGYETEEDAMQVFNLRKSKALKGETSLEEIVKTINEYETLTGKMVSPLTIAKLKEVGKEITVDNLKCIESEEI